MAQSCGSVHTWPEAVTRYCRLPARRPLPWACPLAVDPDLWVRRTGSSESHAGLAFAACLPAGIPTAASLPGLATVAGLAATPAGFAASVPPPLSPPPSAHRTAELPAAAAAAQMVHPNWSRRRSWSNPSMGREAAGKTAMGLCPCPCPAQRAYSTMSAATDASPAKGPANLLVLPNSARRDISSPLGCTTCCSSPHP